MKNFIARLLHGAARNPPQLGAGAGLARKRKPHGKDWRERAVQKAAIRYGKPFKCAADGVPREVLLGDRTSRVIELRSTQGTAVVTQFPKPVGAGGATTLKAV